MTRTAHTAHLLAGTALAAALLIPQVSSGQTAPSPPAPAPAAAPLWNGLGTHGYPVTTSDPRAQAWFDQGLRLAYAFNHAEARRSFQEAQRIDPTCAMCDWGEALVLGPNINAPMDPSANAPALAALDRARAKAAAGRATDKERALIDALATRYSADPNADRAALDRAWADALGAVHRRWPGDQDIAVLYAEALMDTQPWDYWEAGGSRPKGRGGEIVATLERVLAANPDHPGAIHFYIHAVEASDRPERAEPYADRLAALMPAAGHIVHMPSHIYYRVGRYQDSLDANKAAVAADEAFIAANPAAEGIYPKGYYPHNIHFLVASAQQAGDARAAIQAADKLDSVISDETARAVAMVQPMKVAPYFAHAQFSDPATILALPRPGEGLPYVTAMWHYARGVAQAEAGNPDAARAEAAAIAALKGDPALAALESRMIPAGKVMDIARHVVTARAAQTEGDPDTAIAELTQAAAIQDSVPYMEPPYWYYPVRQSLGAVLLLSGRPDEAEKAFQQSLAQAPGSGWALYGLRETYAAKGDTARAQQFTNRLDRAWAGDADQLTLDRL